MSSTKNTGALYIVATPIGNRDDITIRALNILAQVDLIAAEDTRRTGKLLAHHQIKGHLLSYHEHNEKKRTPDLVNKLKTGSSIALVSDAGTPSVSDPGYRLVKEAIANNIKVIPIPGVSAVITALSAAGIATDAFVFVGFFAKKKAKRLKQLQALVDEPRTIVLYESPKRILTFLKEIKTVMGNRYGVLCREMTKLHEEFIRGPVSEIISELSSRSTIKGECTLLLTGRTDEREPSLESVRNELRKAFKETDGTLSEIAKTVAKKCGLPRNTVYDEALKLKHKISKG
ncbi:MAG: 16S rRNA (cytidine(1402)-2'-O)-methyltransferase [Desulfobacterales bacterium]|nr:MAG: 16S rRNA (cytidine(1402)-2'-O)-methyltransferase [Desulfobacterales bacterium]UCD91549.1 MAG: 16S rRNA (cytidine(1402)-2'-O)-methyltransferase [Desulfobacterales bacterium]